jgi:hypothetical protein
LSSFDAIFFFADFRLALVRNILKGFLLALYIMQVARLLCLLECLTHRRPIVNTS